MRHPCGLYYCRAIIICFCIPTYCIPTDLSFLDGIFCGFFFFSSYLSKDKTELT